MSSNTLIVLLPLLALLLAAVSIAALYYWWSSGQEESAEGQDTGTVGELQPQEYQLAEPTVGDLLGKVTTSAQSWLANITKTGSTPSSDAAPISSYPTTSGVTSVSDSEMVEVLRILRDLADGRLVIEIGGKRYRNLAEITDPQVRRRFMGNAEALAHFAAEEASSSDQDIWSYSPAKATEQPTTSSQPIMPSSSVPVEASPAPDTAEETEVPKTIADEIEEMIQYRLGMTPALTGRSIHIRSAMGGGIRVEVDGHGFDSVSDVTDSEVLAFIQSVIREWEARS